MLLIHVLSPLNNKASNLIKFPIDSDYTSWRNQKLRNYVGNIEDLIVHIKNPRKLSLAELHKIKKNCRDNNFSFYQFPNSISKSDLIHFASQFGLKTVIFNPHADLNGISELSAKHDSEKIKYIPYTRRSLNWHTDGYYNELDQHIRSFLLHCINPAPEGGENMLINHELIYIHLYEQNPQLAAALMQTDALTIPANIENNVEIRPEQSGPVFYRDNKTKTLQMRYTARSKSIEWKDDPLVLEAKSIIETLLQEDRYVTHYQLNAGEGLVCNNILHGRTAFTNGSIPEEQRLMYRIRSYDRLFSE